MNSDGRVILDVFVAHNSTFIDWRYIFQKQSEKFCLDFKILRAACIALHKATLVFLPDWRMPRVGRIASAPYPSRAARRHIGG